MTSNIQVSSLCSSPEETFLLPVYAEAVAQESLLSSPVHVASSRYFGDPRVLQFMDVSAIEETSTQVSHIASMDDPSRSSTSGFYLK